MNTNDIDPDFPTELPPTEPVGERVVKGEAAFAAECLDLAQTVVKGERKFVGAPVITWTAKWGLVWRADYEIPGSNYDLDGRPLINRVICWQTPKGAPVLQVEYFRDVPPLHPSK